MPTARCSADIRGFRAQSLRALSGMSLDRIDKNLHEVHWRPAPPVPDTTEDPGDSDGTWLVFADSSPVGEAFLRELHDGGRSVVTVTHDDVADVVHARPDQYVINPAVAEHYRQVLREVTRESAPSKVVHLWSLDIPSGEDVRSGLAREQTGSRLTFGAASRAGADRGTGDIGSPRSGWSPARPRRSPTHPVRSPSRRHRSGESAASSVTRNYRACGAGWSIWARARTTTRPGC